MANMMIVFCIIVCGIEYILAFENPVNNFVMKMYPYKKIVNAMPGAQVCMKYLGCFKITPDYAKRPINVLPNDRNVVNAKFLLFTRQNLKKAYYLKPEIPASLAASKFDKNAPTIFIIHGFLENMHFSKWTFKMKDALLSRSPGNVIIVDWSGGAKGMAAYPQACANIRVVGAEIAFLFKNLQNQFKAKAEDCHIIGFSLGSHIAGYAGSLIKNLGRITGLDPAGPYFEGLPASVRLDPTDATFVDAVHTNAGTLGIIQMVGHVDIYLNGGASQPGCRKILKQVRLLFKAGIIDTVRSLSMCHHDRADLYMIETIRRPRPVPVAYACPDYETFLKGMCTDCGPDMKKCAIFGMRAIEYKPPADLTKKLPFFITTGSNSYFFYFKYEVIVKFRNKHQHHIGMTITLQGTVTSTTLKLLGGIKMDEMKHKYFLNTRIDIGQLNSVLLSSHIQVALDCLVVLSLNQVEKLPRSTEGRIFSTKPNSLVGQRTQLIKCGDCKL